MTDNTQEKDLRFIVEDSTTTTTNGSVVFLSRTTMNNQNIWSGGSVLLKGNLDLKTAVTVLADENGNLEGDRIRMNATIRCKLGLAVGDSVQLKADKEIHYGHKITVRPVATNLGNSADLNSTNFDLLRRENLLEAYVRPYFYKAYRPVHQGDTFIVDKTAGGKKIKFQVIQTSPFPFCIVGPGTNIEISLTATSMIPAPSNSIQGNLPLQKDKAVWTLSSSKKRNSNEGSEDVVENKQNKTHHLAILNASSTPTNSIQSTASTFQNQIVSNTTKDGSIVGQNIYVKTVKAHSKADLQGMADKLSYINTLIAELKYRFVNPQLSQLQNWSTKFLKLEQDLHDDSPDSRNIETTIAFFELLMDPALRILIEFLAKTERNIKAMKMCDIVLTQVPIFLGSTFDLWFWLYFKAISLAGSGQAESSLKLLENVEQKHNTVAGYNFKPVLKAKYSVGCILNLQMKFIEALPVLQSVYDQQLISLGADDLDTLNTSFEIGKSLTELEKDQEALTIFQSVYKKWKLLLGANHEYIFNVEIRVLHILMNLKRYDEALTLAQKIYDAKVISEGPQHSRTLVVQRYIQNCINLKKKQ